MLESWKQFAVGAPQDDRELLFFIKFIKGDFLPVPLDGKL